MAVPGAYGFALQTRDGQPLPDLGSVPDDAVTVSVSWTLASSLSDVADVVENRRYRFGRRGGGILEVDRAPAAIRMGLPNATSAAAVVHPLLTTPLAFLAHWRGDLTLHGGAFVAHDRAWVVTGEREAGKSSMLTALGGRGYPVMADDLVVVGKGIVRAGPACVDLRPDLASRYPQARSVGVVGTRERHRLTLPAAPTEVPYGGAVLLGWHDDEPAIQELPLEDRLRLIDEQHYARPLGPPPQDGVLAALTMPMWHLRRRPDWASADAVLDQLLECIGANTVHQ
jgi:hypothetical protein